MANDSIPFQRDPPHARVSQPLERLELGKHREEDLPILGPTAILRSV